MLNSTRKQRDVNALIFAENHIHLRSPGLQISYPVSCNISVVKLRASSNLVINMRTIKNVEVAFFPNTKRIQPTCKCICMYTFVCICGSVSLEEQYSFTAILILNV